MVAGEKFSILALCSGRRRGPSPKRRSGEVPMTIFDDLDVDDCPFLHRWTIMPGDGGYPIVTGQHAFHEGVWTAVDEVYVVDPLLRWVITNHSGYRLSGARRAQEVAEYGINRKN
jgi:hypothetical protein